MMSLTFIPQSSTCKGVIVSMISMKPLTSSIHSQHTKSCFLSRNAYNFKRHEADNPSQKTSEDFQSMKISFRVNTGKARSESKNNQSLPEERSMHGNTLNGSKNRVTMSNQNFGGENSVAKRGLGSIFHRVNPGKKEDERMSQRSISDVSTRLFMLSAAMAMILTLPVQLNAASNHILDIWQPLYSFTVLTGVFGEDNEAEGTFLYGSGAMLCILAVIRLAALNIYPKSLILSFTVSWSLGWGLNVRQFWTSNKNQLWHNIQGLMGYSLLLQALWEAWPPAPKSYWPLIVGLLIGVFLYAKENIFKGSNWVQGAWSQTPAWCATLLFMIPVASNMIFGAIAPRLQIFALLSLAVTTLQIPRAWVLRNRMFFTGTSFCTLAGCASLTHDWARLFGCILSMGYAIFMLSWAALDKVKGHNSTF